MRDIIIVLMEGKMSPVVFAVSFTLQNLSFWQRVLTLKKLMITLCYVTLTIFVAPMKIAPNKSVARLTATYDMIVVFRRLMNDSVTHNDCHWFRS